MATKKIAYWECDLCGSSALPDTTVNTTDPLPKEWVELIMRSDAGYHFELTICNGCSAAVLTTIRKRTKE